jgi:hypothetical protein
METGIDKGFDQAELALFQEFLTSGRACPDAGGAMGVALKVSDYPSAEGLLARGLLEEVNYDGNRRVQLNGPGEKRAASLVQKGLLTL